MRQQIGENYTTKKGQIDILLIEHLLCLVSIGSKEINSNQKWFDLDFIYYHQIAGIWIDKNVTECLSVCPLLITESTSQKQSRI